MAKKKGTGEEYVLIHEASDRCLGPFKDQSAAADSMLELVKEELGSCGGYGPEDIKSCIDEYQIKPLEPPL